MERDAPEREYDVGAEIGRAVRSIVARWYVVVAVAGIVVLLALAYIWFAPTLYSSSVEILVDPRQRQTVETEVSPSGLGTSAAGADTLLLESQVELLRSHNVLDALIKAEKLDEDPEFAGDGAADGPLKAFVKAVIYGPQSDLNRSISTYDRTIRNLRKRIEVDRKRNTYVISVVVESRDSEKAARLANRLAEIYVSDVNDAGSSATREAATALSSRLDDLRKSVADAAEAVEKYRRDNDLIGANQSLVVEQQLSDLNRERARARLDLQTALARRNQFKAVVEAGPEADLGTTDIGESAVVSRLQTRIAEVESELAELGTVLMDRHPRLRRLRERQQSLTAALQREYSRISNRLEVAYKTAQEKADELDKDVAELQSRMATSNESSVQLRELEREAASVQAVYEGFLRRSREASEQIDIPQSTARIISEAYPASRPSHPPALLVLLGALGLGPALGVVAALGSHLARPRTPRTVPVREPERPAIPDVASMRWSAPPPSRTQHRAPVRRS